MCVAFVIVFLKLNFSLFDFFFDFFFLSDVCFSFILFEIYDADAHLCVSSNSLPGPTATILAAIAVYSRTMDKLDFTWKVTVVACEVECRSSGGGGGSGGYLSCIKEWYSVIDTSTPFISRSTSLSSSTTSSSLSASFPSFQQSSDREGGDNNTHAIYSLMDMAFNASLSKVITVWKEEQTEETTAAAEPFLYVSLPLPLPLPLSLSKSLSRSDVAVDVDVVDAARQQQQQQRQELSIAVTCGQRNGVDDGGVGVGVVGRDMQSCIDEILFASVWMKQQQFQQQQQQQLMERGVGVGMSSGSDVVVVGVVDDSVMVSWDY